jgi:hypothetical protein
MLSTPAHKSHCHSFLYNIMISTVTAKMASIPAIFIHTSYKVVKKHTRYNSAATRKEDKGFV